MPEFSIPSDAKVSKFALGETVRITRKFKGLKFDTTETTNRNGQHMVTRVTGTAPQEAIDELERILEGTNEA